MDAALLLLALLGHAALWVALVNRAHATGWSRFVIRPTTYFLLLMVPALPAAIAWWAWSVDPAALRRVLAGEFLRSAPPALLAYLVVCWAVAAAIIPVWLRRHALHRPPEVLRAHDVRSVYDRVSLPPADADDHPRHFILHLPRNESLWLDVHHRAIEVPRLPPALDGLSLVHLSDLHFTGRVGKTYFQEIVRHCNELDPDLVVLTGDIVDRNRCIDWIPDTLSRLTARYGVFCILGNHDLRVDTARLVRVLQQCGLCYLGGRRVQIEIHGQPVILAGNELPWISPAADLEHTRPPRQGGPFRIALSHSPDQLPWAQTHDVDLLLAGHTHGGQIRIPLIGPIFAPSRRGVKYAAGVFHAPPTILHVTGGVSAVLPLRMNCPPEIVELVLHAPAEKEKRLGIGD